MFSISPSPFTSARRPIHNTFLSRNAACIEAAINRGLHLLNGSAKVEYRNNRLYISITQEKYNEHFPNPTCYYQDESNEIELLNSINCDLAMISLWLEGKFQNFPYASWPENQMTFSLPSSTLSNDIVTLPMNQMYTPPFTNTTGHFNFDAFYTWLNEALVAKGKEALPVLHEGLHTPLIQIKLSDIRTAIF